LNTGTHLQLAAQILSPPLHARKAVPFTIDRQVKSSSIIFDSQCQSSPLHSNFDDSSRTARVPSSIVHSLFEYQEDLPPKIRPESLRLFVACDFHSDNGARGPKHFDGKLAHPPHQVLVSISAWVDSPDYVRH